MFTRARWVIGLAMVAVVIGACSSDEPETANTASTTSTSPDATLAPTTAVPTATTIPTNTPVPSPTSTLEERQKLLTDFFKKPETLKAFDIESASLVRISQGQLQLEYRTIWASRDSQPDVSYDLVIAVAEVMKSWSSEVADYMLGPGTHGVAITTYSTSGQYRYQSFTDIATLKKVANKELTYAEWIIASGAAFK